MLKILIIDDEKAIRDILKARLTKQYSCWVDIANNVNDGIIKCKKKVYDVIFCDYLFLDNFDGFTFLYDVIRKGTKSKTVLMTAYIKNMGEVVKKGHGIKPDFFLKKPLEEGELDSIMSTILN